LPLASRNCSGNPFALASRSCFILQKPAYTSQHTPASIRQATDIRLWARGIRQATHAKQKKGQKKTSLP
jgi:hypothetical protein